MAYPDIGELFDAHTTQRDTVYHPGKHYQIATDDRTWHPTDAPKLVDACFPLEPSLSATDDICEGFGPYYWKRIK